MAFTPARRIRKAAAVEFNDSAHRPNRRRIETVATLPSWISQSPANFDMVTPIKARACDAWQAVRRSAPRRARTNVTLMQRGIERC
ncbi:hypothetical protein [Mycobacterium sp. 852002-30065_SCH5024008]|uniref:hypothetical protein n=1 Tax=Mycobacterium sp. 852002-30065_SCH5024008 TaxID=1834088 RepID=UPI0009ECEFDA|nr:hypothetical protein [Mycobacterium sp. 852002-30065_SCH5024008]